MLLEFKALATQQDNQEQPTGQWSQPTKRWRWLAVGLLFNLALLLVGPIAVSGLAAATSGAMLWFFMLASMFCAMELIACPVDSWSSHLAVGKSEALSRRLTLTTGLMILVQFVAVGVEHVSAARSTNTYGLICGAGLMLAGILLRYIAIRTLGSHFRSDITLRDQAALIEQGPYRFVRHPSETGLLAIALGCCLIFESRSGGLLWLVLAMVVAWRLRLEDRNLSEQFGEQHRRYKAQVRALLPYVY